MNIFTIAKLFLVFVIFTFRLFVPAFGATTKCITDGGSVTTQTSDSIVNIGHEFSGQKVSVFGATNFCNAGIIVVLQGKTVQRKVIKKYQGDFGVWLSKSATVFDNVPLLYYFLSTSNTLENIALYELDKMNIDLNFDSFNGINSKEPDATYEASLYLASYLKQNQHYLINKTNGIQGKTGLFSANFSLPNSIEPGHYTFTTFVVSGGKIVAVNIDPLMVQQVGLTESIFVFSKQHWFLYFIACINLAVIVGSFSFLIGIKEKSNKNSKTKHRIAIIEELSIELGMQKCPVGNSKIGNVVKRKGSSSANSSKR